MIPNYEKLYDPKDDFDYRALHAAYTARGKAIPVGRKVVLTAWGEQNIGAYGKRTGVKTGETRGELTISVRADGNRQASSYWAGFWQEAK